MSVLWRNGGVFKEVELLLKWREWEFLISLQISLGHCLLGVNTAPSAHVSPELIAPLQMAIVSLKDKDGSGWIMQKLHTVTQWLRGRMLPERRDKVGLDGGWKSREGCENLSAKLTRLWTLTRFHRNRAKWWGSDSAAAVVTMCLQRAVSETQPFLARLRSPLLVCN